uniref:Uncharacterized protein n=1 Tax=Onchocerca volvulus TaxID=6282 RepID=A0A8R1TMP0_ONCVO
MASKAAGGPLIRHSPETKWYDYGECRIRGPPAAFDA